MLVQSLEDRRVLAAIGIALDYPIAFANSTGTVTYDEASNLFSADATPLTFQQSPVMFPGFISDPVGGGTRSFDLQIEVDESGALVGGVAGNDFEVIGSIDLDFDAVPDVSGVLLTGEVLDFGFQDTVGLSTDVFDFRLQVTGGALASAGTNSAGGARPAFYGNMQDIGLVINSEVSTFAGSFESDFSGGNKATFGPIDGIIPQPPMAEIGNFVWEDVNGNGIQDDGNTGVNGVTVFLYQDLDGDGIAEPGGDDGSAIATTVTADKDGEAGFYLFDLLDVGDYFVVFDTATIPAGFELTDQDAGSDDEVDSDADPTTGVTIVTTLTEDESDLTWDAGIVRIINPDIEIIKYVDKIVESTEMTVIDFDSLSGGDIVASQYPGLTISAVNRRVPTAGNRAMIFDSSNPTGGDSDLGTPNQSFGGPGIGAGGSSTGAGPNDTALGNVLIISEDGDASDPDDELHGGTFSFVFDEAVTINHLDLLDIDSNESGGSVVTITTASGSQTIGIPAIGNNSIQRLPINVADVTELSVDFVSSGAISELKYSTVSSTKEWFDANDAPGVEFDLGEEIEFSYHVTNTGDVSLSPVILGDDNATPGNPADDFVPTPVEVDAGGGSFVNVGDTDQDGELDPNEEWIYTAFITATQVGTFVNIGDVAGTPINDDGIVIGDPVVDDDPANYQVLGTPGIAIEKFTNGEDADDPSDAVEIAAGDVVTWTYEVTNTGSTTFDFSEVSVVDDAGTPLEPGDDFSPTIVPASDDGADGVLSPGEVWVFTADQIAESLSTTAQASTLRLDGQDPLSGSVGNVKSYTVDGVDVAARAFSRTGGGDWNQAYLGAYSGGLGVTDTSEGNGYNSTHRVDNIGRTNYVLFEFGENVVVDQVFLDSVVHDSDLSVWIGSVPAGSLGTGVLDDAFLAGLTLNEANDTSSSSARWADINAGSIAGNVLVLAASVTDSTPEDQFKIRKVRFETVATGIYGNKGTVVAGDVSDSDLSHYTNPAPVPPTHVDVMFEAEDYEWIDHPWRVYHSDNASNGKFVGSKNRTGSHYNAPPHGKTIKYQFEVEEPGQFEIQALVKARNSRDNSVWIRVDHQSWVQWHMDVTGSQWAWQTATDGWGKHQVKFDLSAGNHSLEIRVREDGTKIDKFKVKKLQTTTVIIDATDFDSRTGDWQVEVDDDGNEFLVANNGTGSHYSTPPAGDELTYDFTLDQAGTFEMHALVSAANHGDNSFWIAIDDGEWVQWHLTVTGDSFEWQTVTDGFGHTAVNFDLDAGEHTLKIKVREDGTKLDKIMITNDSNALGN